MFFFFLTLTLQGSCEELEDIKKAYLASDGDMETILDTVLCCTHEDEERFAELLRAMIKEGDLPDFDNFSKENKKKKTARMKKVCYFFNKGCSWDDVEIFLLLRPESVLVLFPQFGGHWSSCLYCRLLSVFAQIIWKCFNFFFFFL